MKKSIYVILLFTIVLFWMEDADTIQAKSYKTGFSYKNLSLSVQRRITGCSLPRKASGISYSDLRYVRVKYVDFTGTAKNGELIVNKKIASKTVRIFYELYKMKYPIQKMRLIDDYQADDEQSMKANNTSAFNYRTISGSSKLSYHGKGLAIDLNPRINPCVKAGTVSPSNGKVYADRNRKTCRGRYKAYMIKKKDKVYRIFQKYGFSWGGDWHSLKDYQHFEYRK